MAGVDSIVEEVASILNLGKPSLPKDKRDKILLILTQRCKDIDDLQIQHEKLRCDSEKRGVDLEKRLMDAQRAAETEASKSREAESQLNATRERLKEAQANLNMSSSSQESSLSAQLRLQSRIDHLENEKRDLAVGLERKNAQIEQMSEDYKRVNAMLADANSVKYDFISKYEDANGRLVSLDFRQRRLQNEVESLRRQALQNQKEIDEKTEELSIVRKEHVVKVSELQVELEKKSEESRIRENKVSTVEERLKIVEEQNETYIEKLKSLQDLQVQQLEQHRNEMAAQAKLSNIYKVASEESDGKIQELTKAVEELQKLLDDATASYNDLTRQFSQQAAEINVESEGKQLKIEELLKELENANVLLAEAKKGAVPLSDQDIENLAPSAAAASKMLRSGMSLSQIYNEYVKVSNKSDEMKAENSQLKMSLEAIFNELEAKAPILKKQREDYEQAMSTIEQMSGANASTLTQLEVLQGEKENLTRKISQMGRENLRYRQENKDLCSQVQFLIKEVEESRGRKVVKEQESSYVSSSSAVSVDATTAEAVVSGRLVLFRTIEELQQRNRELLAVVRELSEQKEQEEQEAADKKVVELKEELSKVQRDLDEMVDARERQKVLVDSIIAQRDSYRYLLNQMNCTDLTGLDNTVSEQDKTYKEKFDNRILLDKGKTPDKNTPTHRVDTSPIAVNASLLQSQAKVSTLTMEIEKLSVDNEARKFEIENLKKKYAEERDGREEVIEKLRNEMTDIKVQNSQLISQLEFANDKYKVLYGNVEIYKKEVKSLQDKNDELSSALTRQEEVAKNLTKESLKLQEKLSASEIQERSMRQQIAQLETRNASINLEIESLTTEACTRESISSNLERINNVLQFQEESIKNRLQEENNKLTRDVDNLQRKLDSEREQSQVAAAAYDSQIRELRGQLEMELRGHQASRENMTELRLNFERTKMSLEMLQKEKDANFNVEISSNKKESTIEFEKTFEVAKEIPAFEDSDQTLAAQTKTIHDLRHTSDQYKRHVVQYQAMVSSLENTLEDQRKTSEEIQDSLQNQLKEKEEQVKKLENRLKDFEVQKNKLFEEKELVQKEMSKLTSSWNERVHDMQEDLFRAKSQNQDLERKLQALQESNEKIGFRNVVLEEQVGDIKPKLAETLNDLNCKNSEIENLSLQLHAAQELERKAVAEHQKCEEDWKMVKMNLEEQIEAQRNQLEAMKTENTSLTSKLNSFSSEVVAKMSSENTRRDIDVSAETSLKTKGTKMTLRSSDGKTAQDGSQEKSCESSQTKETNIISSPVTPEQMVNVNRFLRREKEIAETRLEILQAEVTRLKQHNDYIEKQLSLTTKHLANERQRSSMHIKSASEHAELMRKVETVNTITAANKKLCAEKEKLQQEKDDFNNKLTRLEAEVLPLEASKRDLQAIVDTLSAEKSAFTQESKRWQLRVTNLIEQKNKTEADENKKLLEERKSHHQQISEINSELSQKNSEIQKYMDFHIQNQSEISRLKEEMIKVGNELEAERSKLQTINEEISKKDEEILNKNSSITQLRNLGRKYKGLHIDSENKVKELKMELEKLNQAQSIVEDKETIEKLRTELENLTTNYKNEQVAHEEIVKKINSEKDVLERALVEKDSFSAQQGSLASLEQQAQMDAIKSKINHLEKTNSDLLKKNEEQVKEIQTFVKKESSFRDTMVKVRSSITQKTEALKVEQTKVASLQEENQFLQQRVNNLEAEKNKLLAGQPNAGTDLDSSDENKLQVLQSELDTIQDERNNLVVERNDLKEKVEELQSEVDSLRSAVNHQKTTTVISPAVERPSSSENLPTANIRPLPSPGVGFHTGPSRPAATSRSAATVMIRSDPRHPRTDRSVATVCPQPAAASTLPSSSSRAAPGSTPDGGTGQVLRVAVAPTITVSPTVAQQSEQEQLPQQGVVSLDADERSSGVADTSSRGDGQFVIVSVQGAAATPSSQISPVASSSTPHAIQRPLSPVSDSTATTGLSPSANTMPTEKEPPSTSGQHQLQEASMSTSSTLSGKRGRISDSSTIGDGDAETEISPKNKRSRVIFVDPTDNALNPNNSDAVTSSEPAFPLRLGVSSGVSVGSGQTPTGGAPSSSSQPPIAVLFPSPVNAAEANAEEANRHVVGSSNNSASASDEVPAVEGGRSSLLRVAAEGSSVTGVEAVIHGKVSTSASAWTSSSSSSSSSAAAATASQPTNQQPTSTKASTPDPQDDDDPDCIVVESDDDDDESAPPPPKLQGVGRGIRGRRGGRYVGVSARGIVPRADEEEEEEEDRHEAPSGDENMDSDVEGDDEEEDDPEEEIEDEDYERVEDDDEEDMVNEEEDVEEEDEESFDRGEAESIEDDEEDETAVRRQESDDDVIVEDNDESPLRPPATDATVPPLVMTTSSSAHPPAPPSLPAAGARLETEDRTVPSTPTLILSAAHASGTGSAEAVSSPSVPHTPHAEQASARFVFGSAPLVQSDLSFAGSTMDRQMDIGVMIPTTQPVVTSSSSTAPASFASLTAASNVSADNEADDAAYLPTPDDGDHDRSGTDDDAVYYPPLVEGDESSSEAPTAWGVGASATSAPATSTTSSTGTSVAESTGRNVSIVPMRGGVARRSRGGLGGARF